MESSARIAAPNLYIKLNYMSVVFILDYIFSYYNKELEFFVLLERYYSPTYSAQS